jgi:hypothetical protein
MGATDPLARLDAVGLSADKRDAVAGANAARLLSQVDHPAQPTLTPPHHPDPARHVTMAK